MKSREHLVTLFKSCNGFKSLEQIHSQTFKLGLDNDSYFATKLNALYGQYGSLSHARKVFDETPQRSVYLWNSTLRSFCRENEWGETLYLFREMVSNGKACNEKPDNFTVSIVLKACSGLRSVKYGKIVHGFLKKRDKIGLDMFVGCALIELYSKCGLMDEASRVFDEFSEPDIVLWTSMVTGYEQNDNPKEALRFFSRMAMSERFSPTRVTLVSLASACAKLLDFRLGSSIHGFVIRRGFGSDYLPLSNSLMNLYAKTNRTKYAVGLFRKLPERDVISWGSVIACCADNSAPKDAIALFNEMIGSKIIEPNPVTLVGALRACSAICDSEEGRKIHQLLIREGLELEISVSTALIDMYMKCSEFEEAKDIFKRMPKRDLVAYSAMLSGFGSLEIFKTMLTNEVQPDAVCAVKILSACSLFGILDQALCFHAFVEKKGFSGNSFVGASLVDLYSKCGDIEHSVRVFEEIRNKDVAVWSVLIEAYAIHGLGEEAIKLFDRMVKSVLTPNEATFVSVLSACSHSGLVEKGLKLFNSMTNEYRLTPNSEHYATIVDLLGRAGEFNKAIEFINEIPSPIGSNIWGALIGACRIHHNVELGKFAAKKLFELEQDGNDGNNNPGSRALLSNIYAAEGKWENVAQIREDIKEKNVKRVFGTSVVDTGNEICSFVANDRSHPESDLICEVLRRLEMNMSEETYYGLYREFERRNINT